MDNFIKQIEISLYKLYFLKTAEIETIIKRLENLPDSALLGIQKAINEAENRQKSYFDQKTREDTSFLEKLEIFLKGQTKILTQEAKLLK